MSTFLLDYMGLNVSLKLYLFFSILMTNLSGVVYPKSYFYISLCLLPIRTGRVSCSGLGRACWLLVLGSNNIADKPSDNKRAAPHPAIIESISHNK